MNDLEVVELLRQLKNWGYIVSIPPHRRSPGYQRLLIAIRDEPTEEHYDPEYVHLQICGPSGYPQRTTIHRDLNLILPAQICPGLIELVDRVNARRAFFTYGATLNYSVTENETVIDIESSAPLLELSNKSLDESLAEQLVSETEALWAKSHVQFGADDAGFVRSLGAIEPNRLYASTVKTLWASYQNSRILRQTFPHFYTMLKREIEWLQDSDASIESLPLLDEMLSP